MSHCSADVVCENPDDHGDETSTEDESGDSTSETGAEGAWVNAKSPNAVMKLKAAHGEQIHFRATGDNAAAAVAALVALVERDFDG